MRGDLKIRKTRTASGATAIQVVRHEGKRRVVVKHIGSAHDQAQLDVLMGQHRQHHKPPEVLKSQIFCFWSA
jgi:hypothetical protein